MAGVLPSLQPGATGPAPLWTDAPAPRQRPQLETTSHLVSLRPPGPSAPAGGDDALAPQNTHFAVNIVHLRDSLAVWVGSAPRDVVDRARAQKAARRQHAGAASRATDDELDQELADALRQAGRLGDDDGGVDAPSSGNLPTPAGALAVEWAVAMSRPGQTSPLGSSLFRTNADVALPMSHRLAAKLRLAQLFLSLDLPSSLVSPATAMMPAPPERSRKLLLLERGIADAIREGQRIVQERRAAS